MNTSADRAGQISDWPSLISCLTAPTIRSTTEKRDHYYENKWNNQLWKIPPLPKCLFCILKQQMFHSSFYDFLLHQNKLYLSLYLNYLNLIAGLFFNSSVLGLKRISAWQIVPHQIIHCARKNSSSLLFIWLASIIFSEFYPSYSFQSWESIWFFNLPPQLKRCKITSNLKKIK